MDSTPRNVLDYEHPSTRPSRWPRWMRYLLEQWRRLPLPIATFLLMVPACVWIFVRFPNGIFGVVAYEEMKEFVIFQAIAMSPLFLAISILGQRWRDLLAGCIFWIVAVGMSLALTFKTHPGEHPYWWLARSASAMIMVGIAAWYSGIHRNGRALIWFLVIALGAAAVEQGGVSLLSLADCFSYDRSSLRTESCHPLLWPMTASLAMTLGRRTVCSSRRLHITLGTFAFIAVGIFVVVFGPMLVLLAHISMSGKGPFARTAACWVIRTYGKTQDIRFLADLLDGDGEAAGADLHKTWGPTTWQDEAQWTLEVRDPARAADRFARQLHAAPSFEFAERHASLFAAQRRFDTVPILLRYVFFGPRAFRSEKIATALEDMGIPHIARYVMERSGNGASNFDAATEARLARLMQADPGTDRRLWLQVYWFNLNSVGSPLDPKLRAEADAIVFAWGEYGRAYYHHAATRPMALRQPNVDVPTTAEFLKEIDQFVDEAK